MINRRGAEFYGFGVIQNTSDTNLDDREPMKDERCGDKYPIYTDGKIKVNKKLGENYYKDFMNEPVSQLNYEKRKELNFKSAVDFIEPTANENLDFDGNGEPDINFDDEVMIRGLLADNSNEAAENIEDPNNIEPESVEEKKQEKPIIEGERELQGQETGKREIVNKERKLNNTDTKSDNQIKMSDGVIMAAGGLAMALMVMGRNM